MPSEANAGFVLLRWRRWFARHPQATLVLAVLLLLGPFINKAVHLDDPLFLWTAQQIQAHPLDPYGFDVKWGPTAKPMSVTTQNPPLAAYYLAVVAGLFGWSEWVLHTAFLLPAVAAVLGAYHVARRLCRHPVFAALATLLTPVFLVSSTTLMCDTLMLAFWVWAIVLWDRGLERKQGRWLLAAAVLATLAEVTKYFGVCLVPLLALYTWLRRDRAGHGLAWLLIPIAAVFAYQVATFRLYGHGMFLGAGQYALITGHELQMPLAAGWVGILEFTGGCLAWPLFATPFLWRKAIGLGAVGLSVGGAVIFHFAMGYDLAHPFEDSSPFWVGVQVAVWMLAGLTLAGLAVSDVWRERTPESWLLLCWVAGTMVFAGFLNWTLNARSLLPLAPAAAILLVRRFEFLAGDYPIRLRRALLWTLVPAGLLALAVARADYLWAKANRVGAQAILARYGTYPGQLCFTGSWGFEYYMTAGRGKYLDVYRSWIQDDDLLVLPLNNPGADVPQTQFGRYVTRLVVVGPSWLATMSHETGSGFYASVWGPLPFSFGPILPERFVVLHFPRGVQPVRPP